MEATLKLSENFMNLFIPIVDPMIDAIVNIDLHKLTYGYALWMNKRTFKPFFESSILSTLIRYLYGKSQIGGILISLPIYWT
jgi:hypothetical protein